MKPIEEANTAEIGKDVLAHCILVYSRIDPLEDGSGVTLTMVCCIEFGGSLPDFVKKKIADEQSESSEVLVKNLRKKKGLN